MATQVQSPLSVRRSFAEPMAASWRKMVGVALLWFALASLAYLTRSVGQVTAWVALVGFAAFASGLLLFADGFKRSIVAELQADRHERLGNATLASGSGLAR